MDEKIKENLDNECNKLFEATRKQKDVTLNITSSFGIGTPHLSYFVLGLIYASLQGYFKDLYFSKGIGQEHIMTKDWEEYWKSKYPSFIEKLTKIYGL